MGKPIINIKVGEKGSKESTGVASLWLNRDRETGRPYMSVQLSTQEDEYNTHIGTAAGKVATKTHTARVFSNVKYADFEDRKEFALLVCPELADGGETEDDAIPF